MNAHQNFSLLSEPFRATPQLAQGLQQHPQGDGQCANTEKSLAQLLILENRSNSVISGSISSNNMTTNLLKASDLMSSSVPSQNDLSNYDTNSLVSAMAAQQVPGVRTGVLNRLLFSAPVSASSTTAELCQQALNEMQSTNSALDSTQATQDNSFAAFEPAPINEDNMNVLQQVNDVNALQYWKQQQQQQMQQMQNLLNMAFQQQPSSTDNMQQGADLGAFIYGNSSANEAVKRELHTSSILSSAIDPDLFRPSKKQRGDTTPPVVPIDEDTLNQSGRFRDYQSCQWSVRFNELQIFRKEKGHCFVPHGYPENPVLARWVKRQRYQYKLRVEAKSSTMTIERINALERIGFVWDSHGAGWLERYNELKEYASRYGTCNISSAFTSFHGNQLSSWVKCQRRQYKMYLESKPTNMNAERIAKLESIGFEWELRRSRKSIAAITAKTTAASPSSEGGFGNQLDVTTDEVPSV